MTEDDLIVTFSQGAEPVRLEPGSTLTVVYGVGDNVVLKIKKGKDPRNRLPRITCPLCGNSAAVTQPGKAGRGGGRLWGHQAPEGTPGRREYGWCAQSGHAPDVDVIALREEQRRRLDIADTPP